MTSSTKTDWVQGRVPVGESRPSTSDGSLSTRASGSDRDDGFGAESSLGRVFSRLSGNKAGNTNDNKSCAGCMSSPLILSGLALASAAALAVVAYHHPRGREWRKRIMGSGTDVEVVAVPKQAGGPVTVREDIGMRDSANDRAQKHLGVRELNLDALPEGVKIIDLPDQVGGHKMMRTVPALLQLEWQGKGPDGKSARRFVLKVLHDGGRGLVELGFYEKLALHVDGPGAKGEEPLRTELQGFLCPYFGAVRVLTSPAADGEGGGRSMYFMVLADLCRGLDNPCALDVKMGRTTVEPGEREEKRLGQLRKYPNQSTVGFRYVGMGWFPYTTSGERREKVKKSKSWGAEMTVENTGSGLAKFFHDGKQLRRGRVSCALRKAQQVLRWFEEQNIFKFYASSLLLTYDAADPPLEDGQEEEVELRMIDFAHAVPLNAEDGEGEISEHPPGDPGYVYGLKNLVAIMEELLEVTADPDSPKDVDTISSRLTYMKTVKDGATEQ